MSARHLALTATAALVGAVLLGAAAPASLTLEQFVAAREASFSMSSLTVQFMKSEAGAGGDVKQLAYPAGAIARWAKVLPTLFPAGSGEGELSAPTKAKRVIWSDRKGFETAAANYAAAADRLTALAKAGDAGGFKAQLGELSKACDACHAVYKVPYVGP